MKKFSSVFFLILLVIFVYYQNLAQAILQCDFSTVQKYVEKLDADLNKRIENQYIDNVQNPTYLFLSVYWQNKGTDMEKRKMAKYLIEHGAKIDPDTFFYVLENSDYEMLWVLYAYGKFDYKLALTLGDLDAVYSPVNALANLFGGLGNDNFKQEKNELSQRQWSLLDYFQSSLLHKWSKGYSYNAQRDFYKGTYNGGIWINNSITESFYTLEELCRISGTSDYEKCNHTVWLISEDLEKTKQYLQGGGSFYEADYMAMNLLKNEELINFLKDLDFYKPCNIKTKKLGQFSFWILKNYFTDKIDQNTIEFLSAVYRERLYGVIEENTQIILKLVNDGINLHKSLDNFSVGTPFVFASMYCYPETLKEIISVDKSFEPKLYEIEYSDKIVFKELKENMFDYPSENKFECPAENVEFLREIFK